MLRQARNGSYDMKGALRCGYHGLAAALREAVIRRGGQVRLATPVETVEETPTGLLVTTAAGSERVDAAVSTLPAASLARSHAAAGTPVTLSSGVHAWCGPKRRT